VDPIGVFIATALGFGALTSGVVESAIVGETLPQWGANVLYPMAYVYLPFRSKVVERITEVDPPVLATLMFCKGIANAASLCGAALRFSFLPSLGHPRPVAIAGA